MRRKRNYIDTIRDDDSEWLVKSFDIREFVVGKFQVLFTVEDICG